MKIVESSVELLTKISYEDIVKTISLAARNCYQSKQGSLEQEEKFIQGLIKLGHDSVLEHQYIGVELTLSRSDLAQLTRHRIGVAFCVSGDTVLQSLPNKKGRGSKKRTIRELYSRYTDPICRASFEATRLRSVDENLTVVQNKPLKVFFNGNKPVYELTTESGRSIKTTLEHEFLHDSGEWIQLKNLVVGDYILVNGKELLKNRDWLYYNYIVLNRSQLDICEEVGCGIAHFNNVIKSFGISKERKNVIKTTSLSQETKDKLNNAELLKHLYLELNKTRKEVSQIIGCCEAFVYKAFQKFDIVKPHSKYPNRKPGYGRKGSLTEAGRLALSKAKSGSKSNFWKHDRGTLTPSGGYCEAHRKYKDKKTNCEFCNTAKNLEIHHIDKNPKNNDESNIKILCSKCHHLWHRPGAIGCFRDKIISIKYVGVEDVYDLEMEAPYHNYVANGIVVHNCVASQRYCNYATERFNHEVPFIKPLGLSKDHEAMWRIAMLDAEQAYMDLVEAGEKAEVARSVLPQCTATTVVMTANLREWRHIFKMRALNNHAQVDIRELMLSTLKLFHENYPCFFEDLYNQMGEQKGE